MRKVLYVFAVLIPVIALVGVAMFALPRVGGARAATTCTPTGFIRDGINLTAAMINPSGTVTQTVNATGCNIGIYYGTGSAGTVNNSDVYGSNYYGIVNDGGVVSVTHSRIHDIGEKPFNGTQHGVAVYYAYGSGARGTISNNLIWYYQKGGIVDNGGSSMTTSINYNTVIGLGAVNFIAQNGIEVGDNSKASVGHNIVTGNAYSGSNFASSGGILVFGGSCYGDPVTTNTQITSNTLIGNDVGVYASNIDTDPNNPNACLPTTKLTKLNINKNIISNDYVTNTTGYDGSNGYQAGVSDQGNYDKVTSNSICGAGYTSSPTTHPPYIYIIDDTATNNITESGNNSCDGSFAMVRQTTTHKKHHGKVTMIK